METPDEELINPGPVRTNFLLVITPEELDTETVDVFALVTAMHVDKELHVTGMTTDENVDAIEEDLAVGTGLKFAPCLTTTVDALDDRDTGTSSVLNLDTTDVEDEHVGEIIGPFTNSRFTAQPDTCNIIAPGLNRFLGISDMVDPEIDLTGYMHAGYTFALHVDVPLGTEFRHCSDTHDPDDADTFFTGETNTSLIETAEAETNVIGTSLGRIMNALDDDAAAGLGLALCNTFTKALDEDAPVSKECSIKKKPTPEVEVTRGIVEEIARDISVAVTETHPGDDRVPDPVS